MKILAPVNNLKEVEPLITAGADEFYCGVMPLDWRKRYTNIASLNRREWATANLTGYAQLREIVDKAHLHKVRVNLALNALYTEGQYPLLLECVQEAQKIKIDAFIVADLGLLLTLKKMATGVELHISTGATTFNTETARFYQELGAQRIIFPRHLRIDEMRQIASDCPDIAFEAFVLNSGCKNIDGFCTFHHGVNETLYGRLWNLPKKLNFDRIFLNMVRRLPRKLASSLKADMFGVDSACLLNYRVSCSNATTENGGASKTRAVRTVASSFNFLSGVDTCGACALMALNQIGVHGVKIVGRNYSTDKKVKDVTFLKAVLSFLEGQETSREAFVSKVKNEYKKIYSFSCEELCYYPGQT